MKVKTQKESIAKLTAKKKPLFCGTLSLPEDNDNNNHNNKIVEIRESLFEFNQRSSSVSFGRISLREFDEDTCTASVSDESTFTIVNFNDDLDISDNDEYNDEDNDGYNNDEEEKEYDNNDDLETKSTTKSTVAVVQSYRDVLTQYCNNYYCYAFRTIKEYCIDKSGFTSMVKTISRVMEQIRIMGNTKNKPQRTTTTMVKIIIDNDTFKKRLPKSGNVSMMKGIVYDNEQTTTTTTTTKRRNGNNVSMMTGTMMTGTMAEF